MNTVICMKFRIFGIQNLKSKNKWTLFLTLSKKKDKDNLTG